MQHDWNAVVIYKFNDEPPPPASGSVLDAIDYESAESGTVVLQVAQIDVEKTMIGCMTCSLAWAEAHGKPCPGEPLGEVPGVGPVYSAGPGSSPLPYDLWLEQTTGSGVVKAEGD